MREGHGSLSRAIFTVRSHSSAGVPPELYADVAGGQVVTTSGAGTFTPTVAFAATPRAGIAPLEVTFFNLTEPATGIDHYWWDLGDGMSYLVYDTEPVSYTYTTPGPAVTGGAYTVTLTAVTTEGLSVSTAWGAVVRVVGTDVVSDVAASVGEREEPLSAASICAGVGAPQTFTSADGRLSITFPSGAVQETIVVTHTPKTMPYTGDGALAYCDVSAATPDGAPVTTFAEDAVFALHYDDAAFAGEEWLEYTIAAFTWNEATEAWKVLPTSVDAANNLITYRKSHFSEDLIVVTGKGTDAAPSAVNAAQSDLFSGAATWSYPLHVPPGPGGLQPDLTLTYNSHLVDTMQTDFQKSGWVGLGFSLNIGYVEISNLRYLYDYAEGIGKVGGFDAYLALNGSRNKLVRQGGWFPDGNTDLVARYRLQHDNFLRVELMRNGRAKGKAVTTFVIYDPDAGQTYSLSNLYWRVTTKEGTVYLFGYQSNRNNSVKVDLVHAGCCSPDYYTSPEKKWMSYPGRAYLDEMKDVYGNTITFLYDVEYKSLELWGVIDGEAKVTDTADYGRYVRLGQINYGGARQIEFMYGEPRQDYPSVFDLEDRELFGSVRVYPDLLKEVVISVDGEDFLHYQFGYRHLACYEPLKVRAPFLDHITVRGKSGDYGYPWESEAVATFEYYEPAWWVHGGNLKRIRGQDGGVVTFDYGVFDNNDRVTQITTEAPGAEPIIHGFLQDKYLNEIGEFVGRDRKLWRLSEVWTLDGTPDNAETATRYYYHKPCPEGICLLDNPFDDSVSPMMGQLDRVEVYNRDDVEMYTFDVGATANPKSGAVPLVSTCYEYDQDKFTFTDQSVFVAPRKVTTVYDGECHKSSGGVATAYEYDPYGNVVETIEWGDVHDGSDDRYTTMEYVYDEANWVLNRPKLQRVVGAGGGEAKTTYEYVLRGGGAVDQVRIYQSVSAGETVETITGFDKHGNVDWTKDGKGNPTDTVYDGAGVFPTKVVYPIVGEIHTIYDPWWGTLASETGLNGEVTTYHYDAFGRLDLVTGPAGRADLDYTRHSGGLIITTVYGEGAATYATSESYNGLGQLVRSVSQDEDGFVAVDYRYDRLGRLTETSLPYDTGGVASLWTKTQYDALGRAQMVTNPNDTHRSYVYDGWRSTTVADEEGHQTVYTYDGLGRTVGVLQVSESSSVQTWYQYDALGNLTGVTDGAGNQVTMHYDGLGRMIDIDDPDMGYWAYAYDANGNLETRTDARGCVTTFAYDELDRLMGKTYTGTEECVGAPVDYFYDSTGWGNAGLGRRTGMQDESGMTAWVYDPAGRLMEERRIIDGEHFITAFTYDPLSRLETLTYPDGEVVTYTYDGAGRTNGLTAEEEATVYLQDAAYDALGQPTSLALGTGVISTTFQYYTAGGASAEPPFALQSIQAASVVSDLLELRDYAYHPDGNLWKMNRAIGDDPVGVDLTYEYNPLDWLSQADATIGGVAYDDWDYLYDDATGRLTEKDSVTFDYVTYHPESVSQPVHAPGQLFDGVVLYGYDANGNRVIREAWGDSTRYGYDAENRLAHVATSTDGSSVLTTTFVYDGDGQRVARIVTPGDDEYPDGAETRYVGDHYETTTAREWSRNETIYGDAGRWQKYPNMAYTADGTLYLVWVESDGHGGAQVRFAKRDPEAGWRSPEIVGKACTNGGGGVRPEGRPAVAVDRACYVTVAWVGCRDSGNALYARRRHPGGHWSAADLIAEDLHYEVWPALAATPGGVVYLAWESEGDIQVVRSGRWSIDWAYDHQVDGESPALTADGRGNAYLIYYKYDYEKSGYHLLRRSGSWHEVSFIDHTCTWQTGGCDFPLALATDSQGDVHIAYGSFYGVDLVVDGRDRPYSITGDGADIGWGHLDISVSDGVAFTDDNIADEDVWISRYSTIAVGPDDMLVAMWDGVWRDSGIDAPRRLFVSYFEPHLTTTKTYRAEGRQIATRVSEPVNIGATGDAAEGGAGSEPADSALYYIIPDHGHPSGALA